MPAEPTEPSEADSPAQPAGTQTGGPEADVPPEEAAARTAEDRSRRAFFGRSGQLAVMAELLHRRINVAVPEIDVGDDVFVVRGDASEVTRVQVKTATAQEQKQNYAVLVNVPGDQLAVPQTAPSLVYIFAIRRGKDGEGRWSDFIVIRRDVLFARYINDGAGKLQPDERRGRPYVQFRIVMTDTTAHSGTAKVDFQKYRNAWLPWPPPPEQEAAGPDQGAAASG